MAEHHVDRGQVGTGLFTLQPDTIDTVTFAETGFAIEIITDGDTAAWFTLNGTDPTIGGTNCYYLPPAAAVDVRQLDTGEVKFISEGSPTIQVQRD